MSFNFTVSGHSNAPHNDQVKAAVDALVATLSEIPGVTGTVSGWSNDSTASANLATSFAASAPEAAAAEEAPASAEEPVAAEPSGTEETAAAAEDRAFPGGTA